MTCILSKDSKCFSTAHGYKIREILENNLSCQHESKWLSVAEQIAQETVMVQERI